MGTCSQRNLPQNSRPAHLEPSGEAPRFTRRGGALGLSTPVPRTCPSASIQYGDRYRSITPPPHKIKTVAASARAPAHSKHQESLAAEEIALLYGGTSSLHGCRYIQFA